MRAFTFTSRLLPLVGLAALAACNDPAQAPQQKASAPAQVAAAAPPPAIVAGNAAGNMVADSAGNAAMPANDLTPAAAPVTPLPPAGAAINIASAPLTAKPGKAAPRGAYDPGLVRLEVLLDRAGFSPGVIDGKAGGNLTGALAAYAAAHNLPAGPNPQAAVFQAITSQDSGPAMQTYQITASDLAGPFIGPPPKDYTALSKLPALGYIDPQQMFAEKFHMDRGLLLALNPGADFSAAGTTLLVTAARPAPRDFKVARIEVDKSANAVRAYDASNTLVAYYPASVGSAERPAPTGDFAVKAVAPHPAYYYDPKRLTFTPEGVTGKLKIAPGPNNPVGLTWIALTVETYGIHGTPDPTAIGKHQSHGCVRLTNWDAVELGQAVKKGVPVNFVGQEKPQAKAAARHT